MTFPDRTSTIYYRKPHSFCSAYVATLTEEEMERIRGDVIGWFHLEIRKLIGPDFGELLRQNTE